MSLTCKFLQNPGTFNEIQLKAEIPLASDAKQSKKKLTASAILNQFKKKTRTKDKSNEQLKSDELSLVISGSKADLYGKVPFIFKNDEFIDSLDSALYGNTNGGSLTPSDLHKPPAINSSFLAPKITYDSVSCDHNSLAIYTPTIASLSRKSSCNSVRLVMKLEIFFAQQKHFQE
jgi:hypothetical protein